MTTRFCWRWFFFAVVLSLGFATVCLGAEIPERIKDAIRTRVDGGEVASAVVGLVDAEGTVFFSYGTTALSGGTTPDENSVYEIGSITKVFTAILLADMVARNEVAYDDSIEKYLPEGVKTPTRGGKSITLVDLSVQTSGLPRMPDNFRPENPLNPFADYTVESLYEYLGSVELRQDIGVAYGYSNTGVGLLGHVLERAGKKPYEELVDERISKVLGMSDTRITLSDGMRKRLAKGHAGTREVPNWDIPTLAGAGALRSTARDMIVFLKANMGLTETALLPVLQETHRSRAQAGSSRMHIGLGWHLRKGKKGETVWHNGGTGGYRTFAGFLDDGTRGAVVLTNSTGKGMDDIGFNLVDSSFLVFRAGK